MRVTQIRKVHVSSLQYVSIGVQRPKPEGGHPIPSSAEIYNKWSFMFVVAYAFVVLSLNFGATASFSAHLNLGHNVIERIMTHL
jgi:hypothetical protein